MKKKIKIVLLCHYWSEEMAEMVGNKHYFRELSPWIQETLNLFKGKNDVELHVVAPNYASNQNFECEKDKIYFHFYHYSPTWLSELLFPFIKCFVKHKEPYKIAERLANTLTGFKTPIRNAVKIIRELNPDLIHLYGSENPDYAAPGFNVMKEFPMLLTLQGYVCLQPREGNIFEKRFYDYRVKYECVINNNVENATSSKQLSLEEFKHNKMHYFGNVKKLYYVSVITKVPCIDASLTEKKYDLVYYARIDNNKGIEDLIETVYTLKMNGCALKTLIMGRGSETYEIYLKERIRKLGIEDIVEFVGFVENHENVYRFASQAKLLVLPTHNDGKPNTIREAMFMKLPVVANNVGGIPQFNINRICIHLVNNGDLVDLANGICRVLNDEKYRNELIENAYNEAVEIYSPEKVYEQTIKTYMDVVEQSKCLGITQ